MTSIDTTNGGRGVPNLDLGLVDGTVPASTRRFFVVLDQDAVAQLDELVVTTHTLPDGTELRHYGIVVEGIGQIEGAELPSDTQRIAAARTMPGITSRRLEVQVLRTVPDSRPPPEPGAGWSCASARPSDERRCSLTRWTTRFRSASIKPTIPFTPTSPS